jgi:hypothetical protein
MRARARADADAVRVHAPVPGPEPVGRPPLVVSSTPLAPVETGLDLDGLFGPEPATRTDDPAPVESAPPRARTRTWFRRSR